MIVVKFKLQIKFLHTMAGFFALVDILSSHFTLPKQLKNLKRITRSAKFARTSPGLPLTKITITNFQVCSSDSRTNYVRAVEWRLRLIDILLSENFNTIALLFLNY